MIFRQVIHDDLGCASYLIGDEDAGVAAVVDPRLDVEEYLRLARYLDVRIEHVLETHTHADHVSGHGRLAAATGARIHIHRDAGAEYPHEPFDDGWELRLGALLVRALHTPGHRPEHTSFALVDTARGEEPWAVLSGDSLFVGDVARPDLAVDKEDGARSMFRSLHDRLLPLPDAVEVWPAHLGGSMCGGPGMDLKISSTIGFERAHQPLLALAQEDDFVRESTAGLGPQPPNFRAIVARNRGPLRDAGTAAAAVDPTRLGGALVVDVRGEAEHDAGHVPGAVNVTVRRPGFGSRLAWLAGPDDRVVLVGADEDEARAAAGLAAAVGVAAAAVLAGGMRAYAGALETTPRLTVAELHERWPGGPQVLDVRERAEWDAGHLPGAVHAPYHDLQQLPAGLDPAAPVAVMCASGQRASVATGLVRRLGVRDVLHVDGGGVPAWRRAGWPVEPG